MKSFIILPIFILLKSCGNGGYPDKQTKFIIEDIKLNKNGTSLYFANPIDTGTLSVNKTWFVDSTGKFNPGDTIAFQLYK